MAIVKGRGVRVELGATYGAPIAVTGVTNANPGVATATAHGQLAGAVGYFSGTPGMAQLEGQAVRVATPLANTFALQSLNTLNMGTFTTGNYTPVATWVTLAEATSYAIGGGAATKLDVSTLIDTIAQQDNGLLAAQSLTFNVLAQTVPSVAMQLIESSAQAGVKIVVRITHPDGSTRVCYGEPSFPGENVGQGAVGTGSLDFTVKGFILKTPA